MNPKGKTICIITQMSILSCMRTSDDHLLFTLQRNFGIACIMLNQIFFSPADVMEKKIAHHVLQQAGTVADMYYAMHHYMQHFKWELECVRRLRSREFIDLAYTWFEQSIQMTGILILQSILYRNRINSCLLSNCV